MKIQLRSLRARLWMAASTAVVGALLLAAFNALSNHTNGTALERVYEENVRALVQLQKIDSTLREVRFRVAAVLLNTMSVQGSLNHLREARQELDRSWATLQEALPAAPSDTERPLIEGVRSGYAAVGPVLTRIEQGYAANRNTQLIEVLESDWPGLQKAYVKPLQALIPLREDAARSTFESAKASNARMTSLAAVLAVLMSLLMGGAVFVFGRSITRSLDEVGRAVQFIAEGDLSQPLPVTGDDEFGRLLQRVADMQRSLYAVVTEVRAGVDSVAMASAEIAQGSQNLSSRTEEQAANLRQTAASMEQMTSTIQQSANNADQANQMVSSASQVAERGGAVVGQVVATMQDISASSRRIGDIVGVIDGIAFQTNILALNAAVEAARAGEQGRGFAVVASEVRSLAQRSAVAAREIKELIAGSVEKVDGGSRLVSEAGLTMGEIVSQVRRVSVLIGEISSASQQQSGDIGQVSQSVSLLDEATQQNAALVEESSAAAEMLKAQAGRLSQAVSVFRLA